MNERVVLNRFFTAAALGAKGDEEAEGKNLSFRTLSMTI